MNLYSIKMRASKNKDGKEKHISGAEKIIAPKNISHCANTLIKRALGHENGSPDFVNLKIEEIPQEKIIKLKALPVTTVNVGSVQEGINEIKNQLKILGIKSSKEILEKMKETAPMRGAMLLDINTLERLEPNKERGIRATYMDSDKYNLSSAKNHFKEAIVLATKVVNAPNIIGEICVSDDINYQIGYFASKSSGYVRITKLKEIGDTFGGRIFLYNGKTPQDLENTINYIEKQCVLVTEVCDVSIKSNKWKYVENSLKNLKKENLYREQSTVSQIEGNSVIINDKKYKMFASNNYLGLANNSEIKDYAKKMLEKYGTGTGGSRLICGNYELHEKLEKIIANFKNCEKSIVFNSGYCANLAVFSSLLTENDVIFSDELNHASIIDGCCLSKAKTIVYKHSDMFDLEEKINSISFEKGIIVSDAVFSMDGDIANLPKILNLAKKHNLFSYIDEAHSTGVLGKTGKGIVEYYNLSEHPDIMMGTLSKAIGSEGGYIAGKECLIEYLRNKARSYIFSTSISAAPIAAAIKSFEILQTNPKIIDKLHKNIKMFNDLLKNFGVNAKSKTPIFSIVIGDEAKTLEVANKLMEQGFFIKAIRYPTVAKGQARLRIALNTLNTEDELKNLAKNIAEVIK